MRKGAAGPDVLRHMVLECEQGGEMVGGGGAMQAAHGCCAAFLLCLPTTALNKLAEQAQRTDKLRQDSCYFYAFLLCLLKNAHTNCGCTLSCDCTLPTHRFAAPSTPPWPLLPH